VEFLRIATLAEIPTGEVRAYDTPAGRVAVAHIENRLFGIGDECTHAGCSLADGKLDEKEATVECACHGSIFDVETGEPVDGPATDPVGVYAVRIESGWVEVAAEQGLEGPED
jgi:nitrite reductase/ring-hydroxylating ferredoxin subunit